MGVGGSGGDYASLSENGVHRQYCLMTQIPVSGLEVGRRVGVGWGWGWGGGGVCVSC